ncbi:PQQ-binding-like beta-propeller repeat protein [Maioricimonas sp. JC845]|uniref:PQQ-binding-like beta-propeller repeat protein n=1 Tax=Maioricimonas sp. JC845 TaxID=3232138 RepID=UPI003457A3AB
MSRNILVAACLWAVAIACLDSPAALAAGTDWPYWRGPQMNGVSTEKNLPTEWDPDGGEGSNLLWKREDLGTRSTPIVMNGKVYVLCRDLPETNKEGEKVVCLDAATGETIWENRWNVFLSDVPDTRVAWSAVVGDPETGNVFALGVCGQFQCMNGETGETIWSHSMSEEYGLLTTYGGRTNFPIIHETNVIISGVIIGWGEYAKPQHRFIAFDKRNGQPTWYEGTRPLPHDTTYSAPVLTVFNGEAALVFGSGDGGVHAFQPRTGKRIWTYNVSKRGINTTPLVVGDRVYCGHSEENLDDTKMGALFCLDGTRKGDITESGELWRVKELFAGKSSPLHVDGRIYAFDDRAKLWVVDAETGEKIYSKSLGTMMRASPLYADGKIYAAEANGRWYTMKPTEDGVEFLHRMRLNGEEINGSPIAAQGRIYLPTSAALYCIGQEGAEPEADPLPEPEAETARSEDMAPALVQIVPAESLIAPGTRQRFNVRLYNANGQWLDNVDPAEVEFAIDGPGEIDDEGAYVIKGAHSDQAAVTVTAKVGDLTGTARIRVVPSLPWTYDFDSGNVPVTWVGARYRHVVIDYDLFQELNETDPQAAQLYLYLRSSFVNSGAPALTYDDSTPALKWTDLLRFLDLDGGEVKPKTIDDAKAKLGSSLQKLQDAGVLSNVEWLTWERETPEGKTVNEPQLKVTSGNRGVTGNGVMVKIKTIPKGTRSQGWMGPPQLDNYTIQADVMGATKDGKLPDIGLIAQRYTIDLMGASQQVQIRTWPPQLRMAQSTPFEWQADTWYTLKLQATTEDGKAVLRGKVWKKGEPEPEEWLVTAEDPSPNEIGSPGLFGNAKDAEIFYDNLSVTTN